MDAREQREEEWKLLSDGYRASALQDEELWRWTVVTVVLLLYGLEIPKRSILLRRCPPGPLNLLSVPAEHSLDPLTPPSGRGRSPLHCHPSPSPGGRGNHHSALPSCPGSSPARRWSASSRGGSAGNRVRASGCQSEAPAGPCIPALVSKNQPSSPALWKDNKATGTGNLTRAKTFQKFTQNKQGQQALVIKERKESKKSI